jgi:hypothetical protein
MSRLQESIFQQSEQRKMNGINICGGTHFDQQLDEIRRGRKPELNGLSIEFGIVPEYALLVESETAVAS